MRKEQRWAALAANGEILAVGLTKHGRFERPCFGLSCGGYMKWVNEGSRYCELFIHSFKPFYEKLLGHHSVFIYGLNIKDFPHSRIRRCTSAKQLLT